MTRIGITSIEFPDHYLNPDYIIKRPDPDFKWFTLFNFNILKIDEESDEVSMRLDVTVKTKSGETIAGLACITKFEINRGLGFEQKQELFHMMAETSCGHVVGAWGIKNRKNGVEYTIPQIYYITNKLDNDIDKVIYENWE